MNVRSHLNEKPGLSKRAVAIVFDWICRVGASSPSLEFPSDRLSGTTDGKVLWGDEPIAFAPEGVDHIIEAFTGLVNHLSVESRFKRVMEADEAVVQATDEVKRSAAHLKLLYLPAACSVCGRIEI